MSKGNEARYQWSIGTYNHQQSAQKHELKSIDTLVGDDSMNFRNNRLGMYK